MAVSPSSSWKFVPSTYHLTRIPREETLAYFAQTNEDFKNACSLANCKPSVEQARKFKQKRGAAYRALKTASA